MGCRVWVGRTTGNVDCQFHSYFGDLCGRSQFCFILWCGLCDWDAAMWKPCSAFAHFSYTFPLHYQPCLAQPTDIRTDTPNISSIFIFATHFEYIYICLYILLTFKVDSPTWKYSPHETSKLFQNFQTSLSCMRFQEPKNTWAQIKLKCLYQNYSEICCTKCFSSLHFQIQCAVGIHSRKRHSTFGPNEYFIRQNKYALVDSLINIFFSVHFSYNMIKFFDCMDKKSSTIKENWMRKLQNEIQENQPKMWFLYTFFFWCIFTALHKEWTEKMLKNWEERILFN